ncbi:hypothetical protein [Rhodovulum adriaticum]|uniref:Transferrin-binding protein B C-lobe/N-lobe beta barrel domain-containing protein n=1 Tax=Rhodovulum adriaticum TaxID=35804 RepID=A0A4V2SL87_RHOAD|nr:hypothetical protein [Rhodovulum adriaticum]MBK1636014.1 hypothetical protein [Rhodovulum adriaticum]TCP22446.1 hypothetical protein EV656_10632 [Rhodovulum adriaticum]
MAHNRILLAALLAVAACSGGDGTNPINNSGGVEDGSDTGNEGGITSVDEMPPGTPLPKPNRAIVRREPEDDTNGFATGFAYNSDTDEFTVDNLAFDGDNTYSRDDVVGTLSTGATRYALYEGDSEVSDPVTGDPIGQFNYRALYGVSHNQMEDGRPTTEFAIVRTGSYVGYGYGGFIYQRNGSVTLPETGQANFNGEYAGLRDFEGKGGLEYVIGDMSVSIDFEDFNTGSGVAGYVENRRIFDQDGNDLTVEYINAFQTQYEGTYEALQVLRFVISDGVADANGEIIGQVDSNILTGAGEIQQVESGTYYAIVSGEPANEIVGVLTVESSHPAIEGVTVRETGGFILHRPAP